MALLNEYEKVVYTTVLGMTGKGPESLEAKAALAKGFDRQSDYISAMRDIKNRDIGKRALKERQSNRMARILGTIAPRTQQQTATLLSSAPATATLLG